jgi:hypothetical protein
MGPEIKIYCAGEGHNKFTLPGISRLALYS